MRTAIDETDRRRAIQVAYNEEHGITPETIVKGISDITEFLMGDVEGADEAPSPARAQATDMAPAEIETTIVELEEEMLAAAEELRFEYAAQAARRDPRAETRLARSHRPFVRGVPWTVMATQPRVPGAASNEVDFELERFERTGPDRIEIAGRWYGLRGRRFVRPVLNLRTGGGSRRRAIALLEHKPWAADDGETWLAAFTWPKGAADIEGAELEVGPGLAVELPAPGAASAGRPRVSALRPYAPTPSVTVRSDPDAPEPSAAPHRDRDAPRFHEAPHRPERDGAAVRRSAPAWEPADRQAPARERPADGTPRGRSASRPWDAPDAPQRERAISPPRDVLTAAFAERDEAVSARDAAERDRIQALVERDDALSRRDAALRDADRAAEERDEAVAERDRLRSEIDRITHERDVADAERKRTLNDAEAIERDRDQAAAERDAARAELARALPSRDVALREAEQMSTRAEQAESERDTALAERKSAVAQRDRARRERDRAMRAAGVDPPVESPHVAPTRPVAAPPAFTTAPADPETDGAAPAEAAPGAHPPGTALPSRPVRVIGASPSGPTPEPKPLLTPVDSGLARRLSRTRRTPSTPARWAVRFLVVIVLIAVVAVLAALLLSVL